MALYSHVVTDEPVVAGGMVPHLYSLGRSTETFVQKWRNANPVRPVQNRERPLCARRETGRNRPEAAVASAFRDALCENPGPGPFGYLKVRTRRVDFGADLSSTVSVMRTATTAPEAHVMAATAHMAAGSPSASAISPARSAPKA